MEVAVQKVDLKKECSQNYKAGKLPEMVDVSEGKFLSLSGIGAPEDALFLESLAAIYAVAFRVKKQYQQIGCDFVIPKLECFWWVESDVSFDKTPRKEWFWELLIRMPEFVEASEVDDCIVEVIRKKNISLANEVYLKKITEGKSVQIMHIGSYEEEKPSIDKMLEYVAIEGLEISGHHHEVYISDPRNTPTERLKTILRYAVKPISIQ